jgi:hypothetical protein
MKRLLFLFIFLLLSSGVYPVNKITRLQKQIDSICHELVRDKRVDMCNINVSKGKNGKLELMGEVLSKSYKDKILEIAARSGKKIIDKIIVLPDTSVIKKSWGLVTVSVANLKSEPSHSSEMASQAIMGTPVRILKKNNGWSYIQTPDHYLAWISNASIGEMDELQLQQWRKSARVIFPGNYGVVCSDTSGTEIVSDLVAGCILSRTGESGNYFQVALPNSVTGFVPKSSLVDFDLWKRFAEVSSGILIATAKKFLGIPYMWGGTSSKTVDCSGFMKNVWFLNGIILERDASQQFRHGEKVDTEKNFENLKPGDVLFFGRKDPQRIVHTGMYIGNGEVIHASGRVMINSLDPSRSNFSKYLAGTFVGANRIIYQQPQFGYMPVKDHPWY